MNIKWLLPLVSTLVPLAPASAATLAFDTNFTGSSYTEAGMTLTQTAASDAPIIVDGDLDLYCCTYAGLTAQYDLTTGGLFNLLSIDVTHQDDGDPISFQGFLGATLVKSAVIDGGYYGTYTFSGFTGLDKVVLTMTGRYNDPNLDNLVYGLSNSVPEPASWALMILGFGAIGATMRRRAAAVAYA
jgi:hypothetical protein